MDYSKIKLIVTDMDGTLLNNKSEVSQLILRQVPELKDKGVRFAVASGRQYFSLKERLQQVASDVIFIAENGAITMIGEKEVDARPMSRTLVHELIDKMKSMGKRYIIACGKEKAYIEHTDEVFMQEFLKHYENYEVVKDLKSLDVVFLKLTLCELDGAEKHALPHFEKYKNQLQVKLSGKVWVDFNHKDAHKGNALRAIQQRFGISKEETMAFGDYLNDLELYEFSGIGYAVDNAHPEVKKVASHTTRSNEDNGVELVIAELLNSRSA